MEKYLIALDLDGTLLTEEKIIPQRSKDYIRKVINDGHKVVIATGRPYAGMSNYYEELNLDTPIINCNGGMIHNPKDNSFKTIHQGMDKDEVKEVFLNVDSFINDAYYSFGKNIYYTSLNDRLKCFIHIKDDSVIKEGKIYETIEVNPSGIIILVKPEKSLEFEKYINDNHKGLSFRVFQKEEENIVYELYQKSISKATGLEYLLKYFDMDPKNLIAIGDGDNDIEMLEYAYVGVAMSSGQKHVIDCAKFITRCSNDEEGVIWFLDHFLGYNTMK